MEGLLRLFDLIFSDLVDVFMDIIFLKIELGDCDREDF